MRLIVCGKGGCGKSTVTALLARQYASTGKQVVVVDTDVSNTGLHRILGAEAKPDLSEFFGGKKNMMELVRTARESGAAPDAPVLGSWTYATIPEGFGANNDAVQLVSIGKLRDTSEGCTCSISSLARQFLMGLSVGENERVIVDTDAGIEHFGRGIDKLCDAIVMVVDPSYESICLVKKIGGMAEAVEVPLFFVLNRTDESSSEILREAIPDASKILGEFRLDLAVLEAGLEGRAMPLGYPAAAALLTTLKERIGRN